MSKRRESRLERQAQLLLAGRNRNQVTVTLRLSGRAGEVWEALATIGAHAGLRPNEVMGLLLHESGSDLERVLRNLLEGAK